MTTVRKWGLQYCGDVWALPVSGTASLPKAALYGDVSEAISALAIRMPAHDIPTVREVLVTQEAGGIELGERWRWASNDAMDCVVSFTKAQEARHSGYIGFEREPSVDINEALVFVTSALAWENAARFVEMRGKGDGAGYCEVWSIRRTEPREVRRVGRTLDELLASVQVEVPSDE